MGGGGADPNESLNLMRYCRTAADQQAATECNIASGQGNVVTTGTLNAGRTVVRLADARGWQQQDWQRQGIRLKRAGYSARLQTEVASGGNRKISCASGSNDPNGDLTTLPGYHTAAQLKYRVSRTRTTGNPVPPTLSYYDELRLVVRASQNFNAGEVFVQIPNWTCTVTDPVTDDQIGAVNGKAGARLSLPALGAGVDTEVFLHINREIPAYTDRLDFYVSATACDAGCVAGLGIEMREAEVVADHVTRVTRVNGVELTLDAERPALRDPCAGRANCSIAVTHDDTYAIRSWLDYWGRQASAAAPAMLYVPNGTYQVSHLRSYSEQGVSSSEPIPIYSHTSLRCENRDTAVFRTVANRATGKGHMFWGRVHNALQQQPPQLLPPHHVTVTGCGFDFNGWNGVDFGTLLSLSGFDVRDANGDVEFLFASHINVIGNRFTDSAPPGREGCDHGDLKKCATRQRLHVLAQLADDVVIRDNILEHGGRIKAASPGQRITIADNTIDFVNDNGITIVQTGSLPYLRFVTSDISIVNNTIRDAMTAGIFFGMDGDGLDPTRTELYNVRIENNRVEGHFGQGIILVTPWRTSGVSITGNAITRSAQSTPANAIWADLACASATVGLTVYPGGGGQPTDFYTDPADRADVRDIRIEANTITMNRQAGNNNYCTTLSGDRAYASTVGVWLRGPRADMSDTGLQNLVVRNNDIRCSGCGERGPDPGNDGVWFNAGRFTNALVENNRIADFQRALRVDDNYYAYNVPPAADTELRMLSASFANNVLTGSKDVSGGQIYLSATHYGVGTTVPDYLNIQMTGNQMTNGDGYGIFYACRDALLPADYFSATTLAPQGSVYTNNALGETNLAGLACPNSGYR